MLLDEKTQLDGHPYDTWLIPCSPDIYDAEGAFQEYGSIVWHQDCNISVGDLAYIYVTAPIKEIRCKCIIDAANIPADIGNDDGYTLNEEFCSRTHKRYMQLRLLDTYDNPFLGFHMLLANGLHGPIRSQRRAGDELVKYIESVTASFEKKQASPV